MQIKKVESYNILSACRKFLAQNLIENTLLLGDLYSPLFQISDVYSVNKNNQVVGVCSVYRALPIPSIVIGTSALEVKKILIQKAISAVKNRFISICELTDIDIFKEYCTVIDSHPEQQMITDNPKKSKYNDINVERVRKEDLKILDKFYRDRKVEAWTPIQFRVGPYYCVKKENKIVSVAGVHLVTPQIAQLGNIITDQAYRRQGFSSVCTSTLAVDLASKKRIISLFVRTDNRSAINMYRNLGFYKIMDRAFLVMRKDA